MDSSVLTKEEFWVLRVRHHISTGLYYTISIYTCDYFVFFINICNIIRPVIHYPIRLFTFFFNISNLFMNNNF